VIFFGSTISDIYIYLSWNSPVHSVPGLVSSGKAGGVWPEPPTLLAPGWRMGPFLPPFLLGMWWESRCVLIVKLQKSKEKALLFLMDFESNLELHWPVINMYLCILRAGWFIRNLRNVRPVKPVDKLRAVRNFMDLFTCSAWSNTTRYEGLQFYILESSTEKCWNNATRKHMPNAKSCFICYQCKLATKPTLHKASNLRLCATASVV